MFDTLVDQTLETRPQLFRWSSDNHWAERASAWDDWKDETARRTELEEIEEVKRRHVRIAYKMLDQVEATIDRMQQDKKSIPAGALSQWMKVGIDSMRLALGLHTEHTRSSVDTDEDEDFERLLANPSTRALLVAASNGATLLENDASAHGGAPEQGEMDRGSAP